MSAKCATPGCQERDGLAPMEGAEGLLCAACRAEVQLLVESVIRPMETERDERIAKQRLD